MSSLTRMDNKVYGVWKHQIRDPSFINELENTYHHLLISNYGPNNKLTLIRNSASNDFLTSSSKTLLEQLSFFHPCFKFINALINAQLKAYGVYGLYVGAFASSLLFRSLKMESSIISNRVARDISEWIQASFLERLHKEIEKISFKLDIGKLDHILSLVRGIVYSKSYYDISLNEKEHISLKIVEAFLKSIPEGDSKEFGKVLILPMERPSSLDSFLVDGILHSASDSSKEELEEKLDKISSDNLKMIIFTVPLSPDLDEKSLIDWRSQASYEEAFIGHLLNKLKSILRQKGVNVIANQKFIHPALKFDLEKNGFFVIERLGTVATNFLLGMRPCYPVANLAEMELVGDKHIVPLTAIKVTSITDKIYLNILPLSTRLTTTFILTGINIHANEYLKEIIETGIHLLQMLVRDSQGVAGAGCFEMFAACLLAQMKEELVESLAKMFEASQAEVDMIFDQFIETFLQLSIVPTGGQEKKLIHYCVDSTFLHLWESSDDSGATHDQCACRVVTRADLSPTAKFVSLSSLKRRSFSDSFGGFDASKHPSAPKFSTPGQGLVVVDYLPAKLNALHLAFDGFSELHKIGICIFDK